MNAGGHPHDTQVITTDRECPGCGYNLRGLRRGGKCPECGRAIGGKPSGRYVDNITHAPPSYLRTLRLGLMLMGAGALLQCVPLVGAAAWAAGVWLAMTRRPAMDTTPDGVLDADRLRNANRWLGLAPVAASGLSLLSAAPLPAVLQTVLVVLAAGAWVVAFAACVPLSVYLSAVADWASYDTVAGRFRASAWSIAVFGAVSAVLFASPLRFFFIPTTIVLGVALLVLVFSIVQLANVVHWAIRNQDFAEGSVARVLEKKAKRAGKPGVVHDMTCIRCGYDLEGMPFGGVCPECGTSYADITPLPVRPLPVRRPEDEAPIPLLGDEPGHGHPQIRHARHHAEPDAPPAPPPTGPAYDDADLDIKLEPDDGPPPPRP